MSQLEQMFPDKEPHSTANLTVESSHSHLRNKDYSVLADTCAHMERDGNINTHFYLYFFPFFGRSTKKRLCPNWDFKCNKCKM